MNAATLNVCTGDFCNADCPFCISKLTGRRFLRQSPRWESKLVNACRYATMSGAKTAIITGKLEPTYQNCPHRLFRVIKCLAEHFPVVEIQTNGILLNRECLGQMADAGLTTVSLSAVSPLLEPNLILSENYRDPAETAADCVAVGLLVRLSVVATKQHCLTVGQAMQQVRQAKKLGFAQVTFREMGLPSGSLDSLPPAGAKVVQWITDNKVSLAELQKHLGENYQQLLPAFPWGAMVFGVEGVSVCLTDCLSPPRTKEFRYLIYDRDGHLRYMWDRPEAVIF